MATFAAALISEIESLGCRMTWMGSGWLLEGGNRLSPNQRRMLEAHRAAVLDALRRRELAVDPRPDLVEDTMLWDRLLALAYDGIPEAFGALHGLRCLGARLVRYRGALRLERGEIEAGEYGRMREKYLVPQTDEVRRLLREAGAAPQGEAS